MNKKMLIISIITLFIDQVFKSIIQVSNMHFNIIKNFFRINYSQNTGAAWSIFSGKTTLLIIISIILMIFIYSMSFSYKDSKINNISFGILFGGIIGNLIDRVLFGYVRDFLDFKIFGYNYPIFNIADIGIVLGVFLLVISTIRGDVNNGDKSRRRRKIKD